jgi:hypothetical protein
MSDKQPDRDTMTVGSRVRVLAAWSMFRTRGGTIVEELAPGRFLVLLDGELLPMRFEASALVEVPT